MAPGFLFSRQCVLENQVPNQIMSKTDPRKKETVVSAKTGADIGTHMR